MLSNGEYVIQASSVNKFGKNFLDQINAGVLPGFKNGGDVSGRLMQRKYQAKNLREPNFQGAAISPTINANTLATNTSTVLDNSSVYNYNLSVNVSSVSDPNAIAQTVMGQIRRVESQRVRSNKF
jgi:hypothetical protein